MTKREEADKALEQLKASMPDTYALFAELFSKFYPINRSATCAWCGVTFRPKRLPSVGRRSFCKKCGKRAARKMAKRDCRARQKALRSC